MNAPAAAAVSDFPRAPRAHIQADDRDASSPPPLGQRGRQGAIRLGSMSSVGNVATSLFADSEMRTPKPPPLSNFVTQPSTLNNNLPPPFQSPPARPPSPAESLTIEFKQMRVSRASDDLEGLDGPPSLLGRRIQRRELPLSEIIEDMDPVANSAELDDEDRLPIRLKGDERVIDFVRKRYIVIGRGSNSVTVERCQRERILLKRAKSRPSGDSNNDLDRDDVIYERYVPVSRNVVGLGRVQTFVEEMPPLDLDNGARS